MAPPSAHKHVLVVDDESSTRLVVERILRGGIPGVQVSCVVDGAQALALLDREQVDLLITDLAMPVIDGIELLLQIGRRRLLIPVLVMSSHGSVSEARALAGGAIEFFPKPIRAAPLLDAVKHLLATPIVSAQLEVVSLAGLARIVGMERKTCALRVTAPEGQGVLVFVNGELVDARQDTLSGLAAALAVLALKDPYVTLELAVRSRVRTIDVAHKEVLRRAYLAATVPRSLAATAPARAASELEQPPDFRGVAPPQQARAEPPIATIAAQKKPNAPAPRPASTTRRPEIRPPTLSPPSAVSQPAVPPPVLSPPPPTLLRSPPLASRTVTPPPVPAPPRVTAPPRAPLLSSPTTLRQRAGTLLSQVGAQASPAASEPSPARPTAVISTHEPAQPAPPEPTAAISTYEPATPALPDPTAAISTHEPTQPDAVATPALPDPTAAISTHEPTQPDATATPAEASAEIPTHEPATPALPEATPAISPYEPTEPAERASSGLADTPAGDPPAPIGAAPQESAREPTDTAAAAVQGPTHADTVDPREHAAQAPAGAPTTAAPTPAPVVTAEIEGLDSTDYFELMDRAHDLMRVAEFEIADLLLQRALQLRPGDRVVQQNLRVLAKRRGPAPPMNR